MTTDASGPTLLVTDTMDSGSIRHQNPQISVPTKTLSVDATEPALASEPNAVVAPTPSSVQKIQHYELIRRLGEGGMGAVYLARDTKLGRLVAIKCLIELTGASAARFLVEARATARCKHENIVVIHEVGEHDGYPYMVLEHIDGQSLLDWMNRRHVAGFGPTARNAPVPASLAIELMLPVVRALGCAHALGIVHRDLKPGNIMLDVSGAVKVLDFGIAKVRESPLSEPSQAAEAAPANIELTQKGATMGTLPYMSPEQWRRDDIDARSDIWAVGIMLFELVTGAHPLAPLTYDKCEKVGVLRLPMPSIFDMRPDVGPLGTVIDRCLAKPKAERMGSADELRSALEALLPGQRAFELGDGDCPFTGLSAFQEADAGRFFGRDRDVAVVMTQLRHHPLLAIAGSSGAGKSSFVRAGLIPALKRLGEGWESLLMRPGQHPLMALAELCVHLAHDAGEQAAVLAQLRDAPGFLGSTLRAYCRNTAHRLFVFVDQFEELYTLCSDEDERKTLIACLAGAADDASSPVRVAFSIRSDFLDRLTEDRLLLTAVAKGLFLLPSMGRENLEMALIKPVEAMGYHFESADMVLGMLDALKSSSTPLPLLQFAATKLWEKRDREQRLLTIASYEALGGVAGALSTHADAVINNLSAREQQLGRAIVLRLVTPERTRAVVNLPDLREIDGDGRAVEQVVEKLSDARLLHIEGGEDRSIATVELVHESLIERWPKLRGWLEESQEESEFLARVRPAAKQWDAGGAADDLLWRGQAAEETQRWQRRHGDAVLARMGAREARFVAAVVGLASRERIRRRRILATVVGALSVVVVVVSVLAVRAKQAATLAEQQKAIAESETIAAEKSAFRARSAGRMAAVRELLASGKPSLAAMVLVAVDAPENARGWQQLAIDFMVQGLPTSTRNHEHEVHSAAWSPDGKRIVTVSSDKTARVWNADGSGEPIRLQGHEDMVSSVAWSPDGKRIVTASGDKTARVWNADGSGETLVLKGHESGVRSAAWSPDGKRIVTASGDKTARVWNADGSGETVVLKGHESSVLSGTWSPDGQHIVTASDDATAAVWNADGSGTSVVLKGHHSSVYSAAWSPDGKRIVTASWDKTARVWNADGSGKAIVLEGHEKAVHSAAWSPDGKHIVTASDDNTGRVWDADGVGISILLKGHTDTVVSAAWSPDGKHIVTASSDKTGRVWNADGSGYPLILKSHENAVRSAAWSPDGKRIVTASLDKTAAVWRTDGTGECIALKGHENAVFSAAWSPDSKRIVTASSDNTARAWNADGTGESVVFKGHTREVQSAAWSPDGKRIVTASFDNTARVWNADGTGEGVVLKGHEREVHLAAWSPDGQRIVTVSDDHTARVWKTDNSGELILLKRHEDTFVSAAWSPDGQRIVTTSFDATAAVWKADGTGENVVLEGHEGWVRFAAWSPDGERIVTVSDDKTARVWKTDDPGKPIILRGHESAVNSAAWSPNGEHIVTTSTDKTARVWKADGTGEPIILRGHESAVNSAGWSPDGERIVTASDDHTARVWKSDGMGEPLVLKAHTSAVRSASFSPDGQRIVTASADETARVWLVFIPLLQQALRHATTDCLRPVERETYLLEGEFDAANAYAECERTAERSGQTHTAPRAYSPNAP